MVAFQMRRAAIGDAVRPFTAGDGRHRRTNSQTKVCDHLMVHVAPGSRPPSWSQNEVKVLIYSVMCYWKKALSGLALGELSFSTLRAHIRGSAVHMQ